MVDYALSVLRPVLEGRASRVEIKRESEKKYVGHIQDALKKTVFNAGCASVIQFLCPMLSSRLILMKESGILLMDGMQ
jgi:hypothetical protein